MKHTTEQEVTKARDAVRNGIIASALDALRDVHEFLVLDAEDAIASALGITSLNAVIDPAGELADEAFIEAVMSFCDWLIREKGRK